VRHLNLAVPGTYQAGRAVVRIVNFDPEVRVIPSKQRPRRIKLQGSDGVLYTFLLKGHEDLRQDERVMQLLGLANNLLNSDITTSDMHIRIPTYAVIPLSPNAGLVQWVPHCDTMEAIIVEYRRHIGVSPQLEFKIMQETIRGDYDSASPDLKLRALQTGLSRTAGDDINKLLWLKSASTERWLLRRWTFTRTLAAMGMVGYLLGLGDRHPSNLLVDRVSGKIVHIDFGDCFEVAMRRERFPEHVPFRLTRMLVNACGASRLEGPLRITMVEVMRVMRTNRESMMAMLEAFVYDPLISWRLLNTAAKQPSPDPPKNQGHNATAVKPLPKPEEPANPESGQQEGASMAASLRVHRTESQLMRGSVMAASMAASVEPDVSSVADGVGTVDHSTAQSEAITRIHNKLNGNDIEGEENLDVENQVRLLIDQATSLSNLSKSFKGWCPFW